MDKNQKQRIVTEIEKLIEFGSQKRLAPTLGISTATLSQMVNGNWKSISDDMWRKAKVNLKLDFNWNLAATSNYNIITKTLQSVQLRSLSIGISENAGIGKSETYKRYAKDFKNVIHVECKNIWSKKSYMKNLLNLSGHEAIGTTEELFEKFVDQIKGLEKPLIIIDQADKLKDPQLDLFMDFYNELLGHCGFVLSGVPALKIRIRKGVLKDKIGYREIWSRIGSKWYDKITETSKKDVEMICKANGVEDMEDITEIYNISDGDLRKVRREVEKIQLKAA